MDENKDKKKKEWKDMHSIGVVALIISVVPQVEALQKILGPNFVGSIVQFLIAYVIVLISFKKEIKKMSDGIQNHVSMVEVGLDKMQESVNLVATNVKELKYSLENLEQTHASRISRLENDVTDIKTKLK